MKLFRSDSKREIVLRQAVDILLELASQRFEKLGMLFHYESHTHPQECKVHSSWTDDTTAHPSLVSMTFTSIVDYWLDYANTELKIIYDTQFDHAGKIYRYGYTSQWFLRSLILALYDLSLDIAGFPIYSGRTFTPKTL